MNATTMLCFAGLLAAALSGCGQKEEAPAAGSRPSAPAPAEPADSASPPASAPLAADVKAAVEAAPKAAEKVVSQATTQAQSLLDQTKTLLSEKKYQDALTGVDKLAGLTLSTEQQSLLAGLKTELGKMSGSIEKGIASLKDLIARKDYAGGMNLLKDLTSYQLTPEQKQVVDGLKLELQKIAGSEAAQEAKGALGGLLEGKP